MRREQILILIILCVVLGTVVFWDVNILKFFAPDDEEKEDVEVCPVAPLSETEHIDTQGTILFTHMINPYGPDGELPLNQKITLQSMVRATAEGIRMGVYAEQIAALEERDANILVNFPTIKVGLPYINRTMRSETGLDVHAVTYLSDILARGLANSKGRYAVYSNIDISLHPQFYWRVAQIMRQQNLTAISITRALLRYPNNTFVPLEDIKDLNQIINCLDRYRQGFECEWKIGKHAGNDMFIFPLEWLHEFVPILNNTVLGYPPIGCILERMMQDKCVQIMNNTNLPCYKKFTDQQLTFHIGSSGGWVNSDTTTLLGRIYGYVSTPMQYVARCGPAMVRSICNKMFDAEWKILRQDVWDLLLTKDLAYPFLERCKVVKVS